MAGSDRPTDCGNRARICNLIALLEQLGPTISPSLTFRTNLLITKRWSAALGTAIGVPPHQTLAGRAKRKIWRALDLRSTHSWGVDDSFSSNA